MLLNFEGTKEAFSASRRLCAITSLIAELSCVLERTVVIVVSVLTAQITFLSGGLKSASIVGRLL